MPVPTSQGERPLVVRGAFLVLGLVIVVVTIQQWRNQPVEGPQPGLGFYLLPLMMASSLVVQFWGKTRRSPLLFVSLGLLVCSLVVLWLTVSGRL